MPFRNCLLLVIAFFLIGNGAFAQTARLALPIAHTGEVNSVCYSREGKYLLTASADGTVKIFLAENGNELVSFTEMNAPITMAVFSPDARQVLVCYLGNALILDVQSGKRLHTLSGHTANINHVSFSDDGLYCLTACDDKVVRVFDPKTGVLIHALDDHREAVKYAEFSPNGKLLVTAAWDRTALLYDLSKGKILHVLEGHQGNLNTAHFSSDGSKVITSSWDYTTKLFDANNGSLLLSFEGHGKTVQDALLTPDGKLLVSTCMDGSTRIFDAQNGRLLQSFIHSGIGSCIRLSANGNYVLSGDKNGECLLIDLPALQLKKRWQAHRAGIKSIAAHPGRSLFFTASNDYTLHAYDSLGSHILSIEGHTEPIADFEFSADGKWMAAIYQDSILRVISVESGKEQSRFLPGGIIHSLSFHPHSTLLALAGKEGKLEVYDIRNGNKLLQVTVSKVAVRKVQWNNNGEQLLISGDEGLAQVISYHTGKVIHNLQGHRGAILDTDISNQGLYAITAGYDSTVRMFDLNTGKVLFTYDGFRRKISHARFSSEGLYFIYCEGSTLYLHETATGKLLHVMNEHAWFVHDVIFSPDSRYLLSAGADYQAILYDVKSGKPKYKMDGNGAPVYSVSFNLTGSYFALAGGDQLVRVFETNSGKEKHVLQGHFAPLRKVAFTPDGQRLLSIGRGHQAVLWDFSTGKQMYSRLQLKGDDWLLYDSDFRYDGSAGARNSLYFVCGLETISLKQTNDALFVPGLAEKQYSHQEITYPRLADLELCGTLPVIVPQNRGANPFQFQITPREAEIEMVEIYVNDRLTKTIPKSSLKTVNGHVLLDLDGSEIIPLFTSDNPNKVEVVAVTNKGGKDIKTRGVIELPNQQGAGSGLNPNLYAVMIGVNTYQDPALKLSYPVKDALALGKAIELSAGEFLGPEHVYMYPINSEVKPGTGYATPERDNIRRALEEIGQLARPEDVVLIFFAGHGMMNGLVEQKFTLLTAEATKDKIVGISTTDLQSWLSPDGPHKMKANKMILIFDACNSGQASKELFTMMSYNEDRTNRIRQIEDLKEKSGLLIMAASAPNQNAYELPQFEQGLLTYCLLKTLKNNPDILDDQEFLNVTKWFLESERELQKVMESLGKNQDAQPFGTSNLRIGVVNDSIRSTIRIAEEKPQVYCTLAENTETFGDDLQLQREINQALEVRARGMDAKISYVSRQTTTAHSVKLKYSVKKGKVKCKVILLKNNMPYFQGDISGTEDDVVRIAAQIVRMVEANVVP
ncbi:MAG TPA: hypothetical protein DIW47_10940 [Bacteroidetes bacterium]|nr:hypothetical protein [Bacteroidota bacterium]